jgi:Ca-activated chloride channel homolog
MAGLMRTADRLRTVWIPALVLLLAAAGGLAAKKADDKLSRKEQKARIEALPEKYQQWLGGVELLISEDEKALFLELQKDYQRDAFIERFWKVRDPYPGTARNEFRETYDARVEFAMENFGRLDDGRSRVLLTNGEPLQRVIIKCEPTMVPAEVWYYKGSDTYGMDLLLLFYQRTPQAPYRLWQPLDGVEDLGSLGVSAAGRGGIGSSIFVDCREDHAQVVIAAIRFLEAQGGVLGSTMFFNRLLAPTNQPNKEWVQTFETYTTDLPPDAATFTARLDVDYVGRHQSRTILQGTVGVPVSELAKAELATHSSYNLMLNGEVLRDGQLFDNFRYKYDFPLREVHGDEIPLVFQRYLRTGEYQLIVKVEDVNGGKFARNEVELAVPVIDRVPPPKPDDPETARLLAEANASIRSGETTLKLAPLQGEWQTGLVRIDALTTGDGIAKVTFLLDDQPILTKKSPPFNVELDLGQVPRSRVLRATAYDAAGEEITSDEVLLNGGPHRFGVRLVEPRRGKTYHSSLRAQADVQVPEGEVVQRVEFYLNETLVASVFQPPYIQPILLPENEPIAYVRAVAFTPDGLSTEDVVFVNAPANLEEIDVDFVELYTAVLDRQLRPVEGLQESDFTVYEDGVAQQLTRFELVANLPIHAAIMLDVSASMEEKLDQAQAAALHFFEQAVTPKDRAAVITFNDHPNLAAKFTNDTEVLAGGLAGLKAERGTALYDSLIFTLYYFNGIRGQRAVLLLSDGKDESSRFTFDDALEYARRAGVSIYVVGLKDATEDRRRLTKLADETGGRSFFIDEVAELTAIYDEIQRELRSRYLLAYQSNNVTGSKKFRTIEIEVAPPGLEAKSLRGYYPS